MADDDDHSTDADGKPVKRVRMNPHERYIAALTMQYLRDGLGRIVRVMDPAGNLWVYGHDGLGRRTSANDPDLGNWAYAYDNVSATPIPYAARLDA